MEFQKMLALLKDLFEGKPLENNDDLHVVNDLSELSVMGFKPFPYQLDGDYLGEIEQLDFSWCPQILRLVIPAVV